MRGNTYDSPVERQWEHAEEFLERLDLACQSQGASEAEVLRQFVLRLGNLAGKEPRTLKLASSAGRLRDGCLAQAHWPSVLRGHALRMIAAEVSAPLKYASIEHERWRPYVRWAKALTEHDTVLTFNYDRVPDILSTEVSSLWIPSPSDLDEGPIGRATVLKLHGSVDWEVGPGGEIKRATGDGWDEAAIDPKRGESPLASPGPTKQARVSGTGPLVPLWAAAEQAVRSADAIIMVGYRIPPSDAYSRQWLLDAIATNRQGGRKSNLAIKTVLGADVHHADSVRLRGLLKRNNVAINRQPMGAEDFLSIFVRGTLFQVSKEEF